MHQSLQGATFHVEHVIPQSAGGSHDGSNLALACPSCNLHKSDRTSVIAAGSPKTVPLFNPRADEWTDHFQWDDYTVVARSTVGHVTIAALDLNHQRRQMIRKAEQTFGMFPPDQQ